MKETKEIPKIAMVGYLNTQPFQWAMEKMNKGTFDLILANPADCSELLLNGEVDLALIPVASLMELKDYCIHTDFCIGCDGEVRTVTIFSNSPINEIKTLWLDTHSRTSQLLAKILLKECFKIDCNFKEKKISEAEVIEEGEAVLMIGDKVFDYESKFKYNYDLGQAWKEWTGLPFVFAVWVSKNKLEDNKDVIAEMNHHFDQVINNLDFYLQERPAYYNGILLDRYFSRNISYKYGKGKKMAQKLFLNKAMKMKESPIF